MSLIGFRREDDEVEYLEERRYSEFHREDELHRVIEKEPRLVMEDLTDGTDVTIGSELRLQSGNRLDILTCNEHGTLTIIELKRDQSPREAVSQLLDYASSLARLDTGELMELTHYESVGTLYGTFDREEETDATTERDDFEENLQTSLESPQLLLVAYSISDDVRRMTRWMRNSHGIKINCVEFDYYEREDAEMFVPTVIGSDETREIKEGELTEPELKYQRFFNGLLNDFNEQHTRETNSAAPVTTREPDLNRKRQLVPVGHSGINLNWDLRGDQGEKSLWVAMEFSRDDHETNRRLFETVLEQVDRSQLRDPAEIEKDQNYGSGNARFYIEREAGSVDEALEDDELQAWAVDTMYRLYGQVTDILNGEL